MQSRASEVGSSLSVKSRNDRIDAITKVVRDVYADSSLCVVDGAFSFFDSRCYTPVSSDTILTITRNILVGMGASPSDLRTMGNMPLDIIKEKSYSSDTNLLCFENCILDIRTKETLAFSPSLVVKERVPYSYDPSAGCPEWASFIGWAVPDEDERACLQEFCGMCYIDRTRMSVEKFAVLIGSGANGKSVFCSAITAAMGEGNVENLDPTQLTSEKMIPYLIGKRLNCSPDVRASAAFDSALKALASGQSVTGRKIYGDAVNVKCPPIIFSLNTIPFFRDTTEGFFRRLFVFSFDSHIPPERQDRGLASRLVAKESAGILNWILEGRDRLLRNGGNFTRSAKMEKTLADIRTQTEWNTTPAVAYLLQKGYSLTPTRPGQICTKVSATDIYNALGGKVSKTSISHELQRAGVHMVRNHEMYYCVYER